MAVTLRHNKYSSMPDWFGTQSTETATTTSTTQLTNNVLSQTITTATSVDFNNIPIDGQTIVWNNDTLEVPIDNQKIILVDGKLTTSGSTNSTDPVIEMLWELRLLTDGTNYIYTPFPVVTQLGVTMYSDSNNLNVGNIYDGLPIDGTTLYWEYDNNGNKVLKSTGTIVETGVSDFWELSNIPAWITINKPIYDYSEIENTPDLNDFATTSSLNTLSSRVDKKWTQDDTKITNWDSAFDWGNHSEVGYAIKNNDEYISGIYTFANGIKVGNIELKKYKDGIIYLDGDLVVTGGISMYSSENVSVAYVNEDESRIKKLEDEVENLKKEIEIIKLNIAYGS